MNAKVLLSGLAMLALAVSAVAAGPTSTLYLTAGDNFYNLELRSGPTVIVSAQNEHSAGGEYAIAVSGGTIRTGGNGQFGARGLGSTYDLNFSYIGPRLANPGNNILDGTTDGRYNYGVDWTSGAVYRYNLDWSSPTFMFNAAPSTVNQRGGSGISFDPFNNSLWIADQSQKLTDYSMSGAQLSSFNTPNFYGFALAFDAADGTLWGMTDLQIGHFNQYSTSGTLLQTLDIGRSYNILGGEFALVPEPASLSLLAFAILSIILLRRGKRGRPSDSCLLRVRAVHHSDLLPGR
jgi:hypothetical protein